MNSQVNLYRFHINTLCEKYTPSQLAELLLNEQNTNLLLRNDNGDLRSENETLKYLIAKYNIQTE